MRVDNLPVLFTFDVEATTNERTIDSLIWGITPTGERYGIEFIVHELKNKNVRGLFFVDFAEAWDFGKEKIKKIVDYLISENQDIGVHIHPRHMADPEKDFLYMYDYDKQKDLILKCTELYKELTGFAPKSFRAGKYGANTDTLRILSELGYQYDFSEFYSQKWCAINPPLCKVLPNFYTNIIEFPVTVFKSYKFFNLYQRFDKLDFDNNQLELKLILKKYARKKSQPVFILFGHSFSLLDFRYRDECPLVKKDSVKKLHAILDFISSKKNICFISEQDLCNYKHYKYHAEDDSVVSSNCFLGIIFTFCRAWQIRSYNKKAKFFLFAAAIFLIITVIGVLVLLT